MSNTSHSIYDFLQSGQFKAVPFGMDQEKFINKFGQSDAFLTISNKDKRIGLLKYGMTEFYFGKSGRDLKLEGIMFQPNSQLADEQKFILEPHNFKENLNYHDVCQILNDQEVVFEEKLDEVDQNILETESGVRFYFSDEDVNQEKGDWKLNKFGKFKVERNTPFADLKL